MADFDAAEPPAQPVAVRVPVSQVNRPLLIDISRTIARARLPAATGIDRVERAYIRWGLEQCASFLGRIGSSQYLVGAGTVRRLIDRLDKSPDAQDRKGLPGLLHSRDSKLKRAQALIRREALARASNRASVPRMIEDAAADGVYLNTGHDNLSTELMDAIGSAGLRRVALLHDTIPLDHPRFVRRASIPAFRTKLAAMQRADLVLCNSAFTRDRAVHHGLDRQRCVVAPLGIDPPHIQRADATPAPYFVILGTIEPRKNHALLLDVWEQLSTCENPPHLRIIGRRGWENRSLFAQLDSLPIVGRTVFELGPLNDTQTAHHLAGARALLFPSHVEGFGLPPVEALAADVPVIAADLPALRETCGAVPEYVPSDDPGAWLDLIHAYSERPSPQRAAQAERILDWSPPCWESHFDTVANAIETFQREKITAPAG